MTHRALRGSVVCLAVKTLRTAARSESSCGKVLVAFGMALVVVAEVGLCARGLFADPVGIAARSASTDSICSERSGSGDPPDRNGCRREFSDDASALFASSGANSSSCGACVTAALPSPAARLASSAFLSASISKLTVGSVWCRRGLCFLVRLFRQRNHP